jgi:hypothetical protein
MAATLLGGVRQSPVPPERRWETLRGQTVVATLLRGVDDLITSVVGDPASS